MTRRCEVRQNEFLGALPGPILLKVNRPRACPVMQPVAAKLPSGLLVEVYCERITTGHFHVGISRNDKLHSPSKYSGSFDVRVFPERHSSYVVRMDWRG